MDAGFEVLIDASSPDVGGWIDGEAAVAGKLGFAYVTIPDDWHCPTVRDLTTFSALLMSE